MSNTNEGVVLRLSPTKKQTTQDQTLKAIKIQDFNGVNLIINLTPHYL